MRRLDNLSAEEEGFACDDDAGERWWLCSFSIIKTLNSNVTYS
jgi:hypothetical protein